MHIFQVDIFFFLTDRWLCYKQTMKDMKALSLLLAGSSLTSWIQLEDEAFSQVSDSSFVFDDDDDVFVCVCVCVSV